MSAVNTNAKAQVSGHLKKCKRCQEWQDSSRAFYRARGVCIICTSYLRKGLSYDQQLAERQGLFLPEEPAYEPPVAIVLPPLGIEAIPIDPLRPEVPPVDSDDETVIIEPPPTGGVIAAAAVVQDLELEVEEKLAELRRRESDLETRNAELESRTREMAEVFTYVEKNEALFERELRQKDAEIAELKRQLQSISHQGRQR